MNDLPSKDDTLDAAALERLCDLLKHTADQLRTEEPLLDAQKLGPHGEVLRKAVEIFQDALPAARLADKKEYVSLRAAWLEAWNSDAARMEAATSHALGIRFFPQPTDARFIVWWRLRLLALMLAHAGEERTRKLVQKVEEALLTTTELGFGMDIDREAHHALREWGRMDEEPFLSSWKKLDAELLRRAAIVVGLKPPGRWNGAQKSDLHRRARRFARNTFV